MKNSDYWKLRFEQLEAAQNRQGAAAVAEIERQYKEAQKQIEGQIAWWYQRFADNNGISLAEARQYLKGAALKEFKWDVQDYIKYGQDNALMGGWMKELENASAKYHISKLEALKIQTQQSLEVMFSKQLGTVTGVMGDLFESGYYHTAYELQKGFNIGWDIAGLDQSQIEKVLAKPWAVDGKNFSERIWGNKKKLISEVHSELTQNIMLGADPQKAIDSLAKKMKTSRYNAGRLIMTEEAYFSSAAQKDCFEELGVEQYEIVATLDSHTSDICRNLDGKHFPMKDYQPGVTAPPFHVYCRSTTIPYFDENFSQIGERAARDEKTGKTHYIPDNMNYQEWKETFIDSRDLTQKRSNGRLGDIDGQTTIDKVEQLEDENMIQRRLAQFTEEFAYANREHALIITSDKKAYYLTGEKSNVNVELIGIENLKGAIVIHNHPVMNDEDFYDSFSIDDLKGAVRSKTAEEYLVSGNRIHSLKLSDNWTELEIEMAFRKAHLLVCEDIIQNGKVIEYEQLEIMRKLAEVEEGVEFYELR